MIDTAKADLYQLFRSKIFWVTEIFLFIYAQTLVFFHTSNDVEIGLITGEQPPALPQVDTSVWTGVETLTRSTSNSSSILFFTLVSALLLLGGDLMYKRYKNSLSKGLSRGQFFLSKNITIAFISIVHLVLYYGLVFVESSLLHGLGQVPAGFLPAFLLTLLAQFIVTVAIVQFTSFLVYWAHSPIPGMIGFVLFVASLTTPARLLPNNALLNFINLEFPIGRAADVTTSLFFMVFMLAQTAVFGWIGLQFFKKRDL